MLINYIKFVVSQMDTLSSIGALGLTNPGLVASTPMTNPFPASFGTLTTPASPAKSLTSLGPVSQTAQGFNPLQSITSQLQGMYNVVIMLLICRIIEICVLILFWPNP